LKYLKTYNENSKEYPELYLVFLTNKKDGSKFLHFLLENKLVSEYDIKIMNHRLDEDVFLFLEYIPQDKYSNYLSLSYSTMRIYSEGYNEKEKIYDDSMHTYNVTTNLKDALEKVKVLANKFNIIKQAKKMGLL